MLLVDTVQGKVIDDDELKENYATMQPYGEWLDSNLVQLKDIKIPNHPYGRIYQMNSVHVCRKHSAIRMNNIVHLSCNMALNGAESNRCNGCGYTTCRTV